MSIAIATLNEIRSFGSVTLSALGSYLAAYAVGANNIGGQYLEPFRLPNCFDVSYPASLYIRILTATGTIVPSGQILLTTAWTRVLAAATIVDATFNYLWTPPAVWPANQPIRLLLDNGSGHTFDAHAFKSDDLIGIRHVRNGVSVLDTFLYTTITALALELHYTSRCKVNCCP